MEQPVVITNPHPWGQRLVSLVVTAVIVVGIVWFDAAALDRFLAHPPSHLYVIAPLAGPAVMAIFLVVVGLQGFVLSCATWTVTAASLTRRLDTLVGTRTRTWPLADIAAFVAEGRPGGTFSVKVTFKNGNGHVLASGRSEAAALDLVKQLNALLGKTANVGGLSADADGRLVLPATLTWQAERPGLLMILLVILFLAPVLWSLGQTAIPFLLTTIDRGHPWLDYSIKGLAISAFVAFGFLPLQMVWATLRPGASTWTLDNAGLRVARVNALFRPASQSWRYDEIAAVRSKLFTGKYSRYYRIRLQIRRGGWLALPPLPTQAEADLVAEAVRRLAGL